MLCSFVAVENTHSLHRRIRDATDRRGDVRWPPVEALREIDLAAASEAVSRAAADQTTKPNDKGDQLTGLLERRRLPE